MRWSFTAWSMYNTCPLKWKLRYVDGIKPPQAPAAARGEDIHKSVEAYIKNPALDLPLGLGAHRQILDNYRYHPNGERYCELVLTFDRNWDTVVASNREQVWCTMVLDAARALDKDEDGEKVEVEEWKTGREYDEHKEQRSLYALGALLRWKYSDKVQVTTRYLDGKAEDKRLVAARSAEEKLKDLWSNRVDTMERDQIHAPRPGHYCRWCHYSGVHKGGPCPVG